MKALYLLLALAAPLAGGVQSIAPISADGKCANAIRHELALVYEVRGGTLLGPVDLHLTVYSDGSARLVDVTDPDHPRAAVADASPENLEALMADLAHIGAHRLCDADGIVTDVPLRTLTIVKPGTEIAHTYSWWLPDGPNGAVEHRIEQFIGWTFPGFYGPR